MGVELGQVLDLEVYGVYASRRFYCRVRRGQQVTVPENVVSWLEIKLGNILRVRLYESGEEEEAGYGPR
ncbi:MAG: hypothetical protein U9O89_03005 [Thermoproteota archaeon]|nr:hypothetical protein [Thermoproteota archaeon]